MADLNVTTEDDTYVIHGPESTIPLMTDALGKQLLKVFIGAPKDSVAMIDSFTKKKLLYSELLQKCVNLAAALRHHGYGQGTVLSISSENCLNFTVPICASFLNGSILAPLNHFYTPHELEHMLKISNPRVIFCSTELTRKFVDLKMKFNFIERIITLGTSSANCRENVETMDEFVRSVLKGEDVDACTFQPVDGDISKMAAVILSSSGTTGLPKGVALSHLNLNIFLTRSRDSQYYEQIANQHVLGVSHFFWVSGFIGAVQCLMNLDTMICMKTFDEDDFLRSIQDYKINVLSLTSSLVIFLAKTEKIWRYDLSSIRDVLYGAAPLSRSTEEEVKRRLNCKNIRQVYGMTETTLSATMIPKAEIRSGSCGKVLPFLSGKIRDPDTGRSLGPNKVGELCFKGLNVMMGYYNNEQATKDTFTSDGWLKTGDLGYYDEEGYFYVIDRIKELIKCEGYQVAPAELEAILINHPKIKDAGVVGLPDELVGERPLAFVVKKEGIQISEEEIKKYVAGLVSPQKRLIGGVIFLDSIPKSANGKILRWKLRDLLKRNTT